MVDLTEMFYKQPSGDVQEVNSNLWAGRLKNICEENYFSSHLISYIINTMLKYQFL